jgi:2'-5' RNA ligase
VIVSVPEAEDVVGSFRAELDRSAGWGVPAHVTVLYPFLAPERVDDTVSRAVAEAVTTVPAFDVVFPWVEWFGETVVWLAPEPDWPFRRLTCAVWERFPDLPPYGGAYLDLVPHLTIGHDAPPALLRAAEDAVRPLLPIRGRIAVAQLIEGSRQPASWRTVAEFALGPS